MIRDEILQLQKMGPMPDESDDSVTEEQIDAYDALLQKIKKPITVEEAMILVKMFPLKGGLFGVEWSLIHLVESLFKLISGEAYLEIINSYNSKEWQDFFLIRYKNGKKKIESEAAV